MKYRHNNLELVMEDGRGWFYIGKQLMFRGSSYIALKMFITHSDNDPDIMDKFRKQLEQREKVTFRNERSADER